MGLFDKYIGKNSDNEVHFCHRMLSILPDLNLKIPTKLDFSLFLPNDIPENIPFLKKFPVVLFNPLGSQKGNSLSIEQSKLAIKQLSANHITVCLFNTLENKKLLKNIPNIYWLSSDNILEAAKWINTIDGVLTTDTGIGHLAVALKKPVTIMRSNEKWRDCCNPLSEITTIVYSKSDNIKDLYIPLAIQAIQKQLKNSLH